MCAGAGPSALLGAAAITVPHREAPLAFEPNVGQASVDVRFVSLGPRRRPGRSRVRDGQYDGFPTTPGVIQPTAKPARIMGDGPCIDDFILSASNK